MLTFTIYGAAGDGFRNNFVGVHMVRIESEWLRRIYLDNGFDPDHVNTNKLIPETVPGGTILRERQHCLNDMMIYRFRR